MKRERTFPLLLERARGVAAHGAAWRVRRDRGYVNNHNQSPIGRRAAPSSRVSLGLLCGVGVDVRVAGSCLAGKAAYESAHGEFE